MEIVQSYTFGETCKFGSVKVQNKISLIFESEFRERNKFRNAVKRR